VPPSGGVQWTAHEAGLRRPRLLLRRQRPLTTVSPPALHATTAFGSCGFQLPAGQWAFRLGPLPATNLALNDKLIEEARRAGPHKTRRDAVTAALGRVRQAAQTVALLGSVRNFLNLLRLLITRPTAGAHGRVWRHSGVVVDRSEQTRGLGRLREGITRSAGTLIRDGRAQLKGVIRRELFSGIREAKELRRLRDHRGARVSLGLM
jgi:hypothetical protein